MSFKDRLVFDPALLGESDNVGAYLRSSDGTLLTHTTIGGAEALDVNVLGFDVATYDEDSAHASGDKGFLMLGVRQDAVGSLGDTDGDYVPFQFDANGRLRVDAEVSVSTGSDKEESTAHADGDIGAFMLAIRQDTLSDLAGADGDYAGLKIDALGRLWANAVVAGDVADDAVDAGNPIKVGTRAVSGALAAVSATGDRANMISDLYRRLWVNNAPNVAGSNAATAVDDTAGGVAVFASPLAGRTRVLVQNLSNKAVFLGFGTVTTANGIRLSSASTLELEMGPDLALKAIGQDAGPHDVRVMQLA